MDGQGGERVMFFVELEHGVEVYVADYVDVVKEEGFRRKVARGEGRGARKRG